MWLRRKRRKNGTGKDRCFYFCNSSRYFLLCIFLYSRKKEYFSEKNHAYNGAYNHVDCRTFHIRTFPGFKPVTAVVIIAGMYLGTEAGFYCGALTALVTNFYFGQGMYTPFQMLTWGLIGVISALIGELLRKNKAVLMIYGVFAGVIFSLLMDIYTVIWTFGTFKWSYYLITISTSFTFTIIYAVSNVIFLLALAVPLGKKIEHAYQKRV